MNINLKKIVKIVGNIITLLAIYFVFKKLLGSNVDYSTLFTSKNFLPILIITLLQTLIVYTNCFPWKTIVSTLAHKKISFNEAVTVYTKSNILKYLPGNVFQYVGRNELATKKKISHVAVATSTLIDILLNILGAIIVSAIFLSNYLIKFVAQNKTVIFLVGSLFVISMLILFLLFKTKLYSYAQKKGITFSKQLFSTFLFCLLYYVVILFFSSLLYILTLKYILGVSLTTSLFAKLLSAYTLSWLVGLITPGAPAGIGIKEAVMLSVTENLLGVNVITLSMITFRVLCTIADFLAFLLALLLDKTKFNTK
ncbi:hypothetical protein ACFFIF_04810 [Vagococcus entomophilus]|uniref:Phosphatidylglycerol lysyltransferase n=1 Tax=Vagococcus entomophilus TaxID=1160095 RepID=A0A430AIF5_9ENTE|nr:hypothetical protein [Vagococcus entomophilus]RSU07899.1 hypothetical protein CBF30_01275 [Vagococcus entomophilus]